jgi:hypothetical protein
MFHSNQDSYLYQDESVIMLQGLRTSFSQMSQDMRSVGYNPSRGTHLGKKIEPKKIGFVRDFEYNIFQEIDTDSVNSNNSGPINYLIDTTRVAFTMDKNGDGKIEDDNKDRDFEEGDRGERIAYRQFNNKLQRFNSEVYAESKDINKSWETLIPNLEVLNFVFLNADGDKFSGSNESLQDIKSVEVTLLVRSGSKKHNKKSGFIFRNRQGEVICDYCSYSKYRYKMFHSRIKIRNSRGYKS